eukprot:Phypoly_transcript_10410.p1 GENE.Phypoly_transcript_10410~~Phypoly_transcript_10410.p1  ORF type:complete len:376 (+),score=44.54 Phypoly_transcript_10410:108-1235(+)
MTEDKLFVVSDIGGTNARFELWCSKNNANTVQMPYRNTYKTISYTGVAALLETFLKDCVTNVLDFRTPSKFVLGIRGPVWDEGRTNHPNNVVMIDGTRWDFEHADKIEENLKLARGTVLFMNDFQAIGYCLASYYEKNSPAETRPSGITVLHDAISITNSAAACIGAGTGMGACYLAPNASGGSTVLPSEFGGADIFSCRNDFEWELLKWMRQKYNGYLEVERVVCGGAIVDLFEFFMLHAEQPTADSIVQEIKNAEREEQAALISKHASQGEKNCLKVIDFFLEQYGRLLGTAAETWVPYRGLFIAGGILSKLSWRWGIKSGDKIEIAKDSILLKAYLAQGSKMTGTVSRVPLYLLEDQDAGLKGCLFAAISKS